MAEERDDLPSDLELEDEIRTMYLDKRESQLSPPPPPALEPTEEAAYPESGRPNCDFYMRTGACRYGPSCRYHHPPDRFAVMIPRVLQQDHQAIVGAARRGPFARKIRPPCRFFANAKTCKHGDACTFEHTGQHRLERLTPTNKYGFPLRVGKKECSFYMKTGQCKFGRACKFNHPEEYASTFASPFSSSSSSSSSRILQSSLLPQAGNLNASASIRSSLPPPPPPTKHIALQAHSQFGSELPFATYTVPPLNFGLFAHDDDDDDEFYPTAASQINQSNDDQIEHMLPDKLDLDYQELFSEETDFHK